MLPEHSAIVSVECTLIKTSVGIFILKARDRDGRDADHVRPAIERCVEEDAGSVTSRSRSLARAHERRVLIGKAHTFPDGSTVHVRLSGNDFTFETK